MNTPSAGHDFEESVWELPPLILHPFNEQLPPAKLIENSRAALMLSGLIPDDGSDPEDLRRRIALGRYGEIRMLFFLGKDVFRWIDQCLDSTSRSPQLTEARLGRQSFAGLLTAAAPQPVKDKLLRWGVVDYVAIFRRAVALNVLFSEPPPIDVIAGDFLWNYHLYLDAHYRCYLESEPYRMITGNNFRFDLYASAEYSKLLESQWEE